MHELLGKSSVKSTIFYSNYYSLNIYYTSNYLSCFFVRLVAPPHPAITAHTTVNRCVSSNGTTT